MATSNNLRFRRAWTKPYIRHLVPLETDVALCGVTTARNARTTGGLICAVCRRRKESEWDVETHPY